MRNTSYHLYEGETLLECCIHMSHPECVENLLKSGADVNTPNPGADKNTRKPRTPKSLAGTKCHKTGAVVNVPDVNTRNSYGFTPLMYASWHCNEKCLELLIEAGADVNIQSEDGRTALILATWYRISKNVEVLLKAAADVNVSAERLSTPLIDATQHGSCRILEMLIKAGADVNKANQHGFTPLMGAATRGYITYVDLLLKAGADVNTINETGRTALICAAENHIAITIKLLLQAGAKINIRPDDRNALQTHLCYKTKFQNRHLINEEICMVLFAAGEDTDGSTFTAQHDRGTIVIDVPEYLLKAKETENLSEMCRAAIRGHLLGLNPQEHLFGKVSRLGLPDTLTEFLLYNVTLIVELPEPYYID